MTRVSVGLADHDLNRALIDKSVGVDRLELAVRSDLEDGERHTRMLRHGEFDACELSLSNYLIRKSRGDTSLTALPVFPNRKFRHAYIFCNTRAGIRRPIDLHGKRVGLRGYAATASVWVRGILAQYYEVDPTRITWFAPADPVDFELPPGITLQHVDQAADLGPMLTSGELDAVIWPDVLPSFQRKAPEVERLFPDYKSDEQGFYRATGIFPISHLIVVKAEVVQANDELARDLLNAFRRSRDACFQRLEDMHTIAVSWVVPLLEEQRTLMGDRYWPYNVQDNARVLDTLISFAFAQGLIANPLKVEELFHASVVNDGAY
jgi:4,5-dihydroxyphthalate decarboxylase